MPVTRTQLAADRIHRLLHPVSQRVRIDAQLLTHLLAGGACSELAMLGATRLAIRADLRLSPAN
jgi:hypothetical protein